MKLDAVTLLPIVPVKSDVKTHLPVKSSLFPSETFLNPFFLSKSMPTASICARIGDPAIDACRKALKASGIDAVLSPYYGDAKSPQYNENTFPIINHNGKSYYGKKGLQELIETYNKKIANRPETKVISSIHAPKKANTEPYKNL